MARPISLEAVQALRSLRTGTSVADASQFWGVQPEMLSKLERSCRNVPEEILKHLEFALRDRDKLRRLIADLVPQLRS
jgi:hypothetical protein